MKYFDYETGFGGIGNTQRSDIVLNANAVNEQSKAFFKEICKKNSLGYIIISGCVFSKETYSGGVNNISTTAGYIYNKSLDSIIEVEAQNIIGTGVEWVIFYFSPVVKNDNADGIRSYKTGANVNCWKEEKYILTGASAGSSPNDVSYAFFANRMQDVLRDYVNTGWTDISADLNTPDYSFGTGGYIKIRNNNGFVELIMYNVLTALVDQSATNIVTLDPKYRPDFDYDKNIVVKTSSSSYDNKFNIKDIGEITGRLSTGEYCNLMLNWSV